MLQSLCPAYVLQLGAQTTGLESKESIESQLSYLPMSLSSSMQPAAAYVIPDQLANATFTLPIFVRCFHAGKMRRENALRGAVLTFIFCWYQDDTKPTSGSNTYRART